MVGLVELDDGTRIYGRVVDVDARRPARRVAAAGADRHRQRRTAIWCFGPERDDQRRARAEQYVDDRLVGRLDPRRARVRQHALDQPEAIAVVDETTDARVSYSQLWADACRVAAFLGEHGVWPGDVVSVQLPNWYETVAVDLGVLARGAVLNPLLPNYRVHELHHILGTARTKLLFTPDEFRGFDHAALGRRARTTRSTRSTVTSSCGAAATSGSACSAAIPRTSTRSTDPAALSRGDLHVGHRSHAEGRDAHRAHHQLQRAVGLRGQRAHRPTTWCGHRARSATRPASTSASDWRSTSG